MKTGSDGDPKSRASSVMKGENEGTGIAGLGLPCVTLVVIGLNEETHLEGVFASIMNQSYPRDKVELIYVDSGSRDASVVIARRNADKVYEEISHYPTAARGRNKGLDEASHKFIHFLDGDTEIGPDYLAIAIDKLVANERLAAVVGYVDEKNRDHNRLNLLFSAALSKRDEGFVAQPKAGGTFRTDLLRSLGGYDERIRLGEESELGERVLSAGYKILQVKDIMCTHDYDFRGVSSLTRLYVRMGETLAVQSKLSGEGNYWKNTKRHNSRNMILNVLFLTTLATSCFTGKYAILLAFSLVILAWPIAKLYTRRELNFVTIVYYEIMTIMKPVIFWGQLRTYAMLATDREFRKHVMVPKGG